MSKIRVPSVDIQTGSGEVAEGSVLSGRMDGTRSSAHCPSSLDPEPRGHWPSQWAQFYRLNT